MAITRQGHWKWIFFSLSVSREKDTQWIKNVTQIYTVGIYVTDGAFKEISDNINGRILVYCYKTAEKYSSSKFDGGWHLYVFSEEHKKWLALAKTRLEKKQMVIKPFVSVDGLINSLLRFDFPAIGLTKIKGSGCEINRDGTIKYLSSIRFK